MSLKKDIERNEDYNRYIRELKEEKDWDGRDCLITAIKNLTNDIINTETVIEMLKKERKNKSLDGLSQLCTVNKKSIKYILSGKLNEVTNLNKKIKKIYVGLVYGQ